MSVEVSLPEIDAWKAGFRSGDRESGAIESGPTLSVQSLMLRARPILLRSPARRTEARYPELGGGGGDYFATTVVEEAKATFNGLELTLSSLAHDPTAKARGKKHPHHLPADHSPATADRFAVYAGGIDDPENLVFVVDNSMHFGGPVILDHTGEEVQDDPAFNDMIDRTLQLFEADPSAISDPTSN